MVDDRRRPAGLRRLDVAAAGLASYFAQWDGLAAASPRRRAFLRRLAHLLVGA